VHTKHYTITLASCCSRMLKHSFFIGGFILFGLYNALGFQASNFFAVKRKKYDHLRKPLEQWADDAPADKNSLFAHSLLVKDEVSRNQWEKEMYGYGKVGEYKKALELLESLKEQKIQLSSPLYYAAITACGRAQQVDRSLILFEEMLELNLKRDKACYNAVIRSCLKAKRVEKAMQFLAEMESEGIEQNRLAYVNIISQLCRKQHATQAYAFFTDAVQKGFQPDLITFNQVLNALFSGLWKSKALELLSKIDEYNIKPDVITYSTAMKGLMRSANKSDGYLALELFNDMERYKLKPDLICYNTILAVCVKFKLAKQALEILEKMKRDEIEPNPMSYVCVLNSCSKWEGSSAKVVDIFEEMKTNGHTPDLPLYSTVMSICSQDKEPSLVTKYFNELQEQGFRPNQVAYTIVLRTLGETEEHYADALATFYKMKKDPNIKVDLFAYNSMLMVCAKWKKAEDAITLLQEMEESNNQLLQPNEMSYVNVMNACLGDATRISSIPVLLAEMEKNNILKTSYTHTVQMKYFESLSYWEEALSFLKKLQQEEKQIFSQIFISAIQACVKANKLIEASKIFEEMKKRPDLKMNVVLYGTALNIYTKMKDVAAAQSILQEMKLNRIKTNSVIKNIIKSAMREEPLLWAPIKSFL